MVNYYYSSIFIININIILILFIIVVVIEGPYHSSGQCQQGKQR